MDEWHIPFGYTRQMLSFIKLIIMSCARTSNSFCNQWFLSVKYSIMFLKTNPTTGDFSFGAIFGALLGICFTTLFLTVPLQIKCNWIYDYQTLIAGVFALLAGAISILALSRQIQQAEQFKKEELERELRAARPMLAFVIVPLLGYAEACYKILRDSYVDLVPNTNGFVTYPKINAEIPPIPADVFGGLIENLKFGTPSAVSVLSNILTKLQIQNSRLVQLRTNEYSSTSHSLKQLHVYTTDSLELISLCTRMFAYSRGEIDEVETDIKKGHLIQSAFGSESFLSQDPLMLYLIDSYSQ